MDDSLFRDKVVAINENQVRLRRSGSSAFWPLVYVLGGVVGIDPKNLIWHQGGVVHGCSRL